MLMFDENNTISQEAINLAANAWGLQCLRYEISKFAINQMPLITCYYFLDNLMFSKHYRIFCKESRLQIVPEDITPPAGVQQAMEMQAEAERRKRAQILESEGTYLFL
jgi:hypothetical protein